MLTDEQVHRALLSFAGCCDRDGICEGGQRCPFLVDENDVECAAYVMDVVRNPQQYELDGYPTGPLGLEGAKVRPVDREDETREKRVELWSR